MRQNIKKIKIWHRHHTMRFYRELVLLFVGKSYFHFHMNEEHQYTMKSLDSSCSFVRSAYNSILPITFARIFYSIDMTSIPTNATAVRLLSIAFTSPSFMISISVRKFSVISNSNRKLRMLWRQRCWFVNRMKFSQR